MVDFFIARQPILDRQQRCWAYELLFRSNGVDNFFEHPDPDIASRKVIADSSLLVGLESITGGKQAFLNVTREVLLSDYLTTLPRETAVIEIMESVEPDTEVIEACRELKRRGYTLALDDFVFHDRFLPLLELADIVKVDFLSSDTRQRAEMVKQVAPLGVDLLAEKVETREDFEEALRLGHVYFQGYFFSEPVILQGKEIPGFKLHCLRLFQEVQRPDLDFDRLQAIIKHDVSLPYKVLRYVNSAAFPWRREISSIRESLSLLGEREVRKLLSLILLTTIGQDRPEPLVQQAITRARFCESLSAQTALKGRSEDLFLLGMFSLIDALVGRPMEEILDALPLAEDMKDALLGADNRLRELLLFARHYERGDWDAVSADVSRIGLDSKKIPDLYLAAVAWSHEAEIVRSGGPASAAR